MRGDRLENAIGPRLLAPDLPGYGERSVHDADVSLSAHVDFLFRLVQSTWPDERVDIAGHSIGGAIALLFARKYPQCLRFVINVEGNFTLRDAFWSATMARMDAREAERELERDRADPQAWLRRSGVSPTPERLELARSHLHNQSARTVQSMARSVVAVTEAPQYLEDVRAVLETEIPVHLIAGERSREAWDVPDFVLKRAASFTIVPDCGHLVTIEQPETFGAIVHELRGRPAR
jgi:pimeloyl-ACP methyl ester carboxylesterase